jgi:hypothetical protein
MKAKTIQIIGDYIEPDQADYEGSLSFSIRAAYIEKRKLWESKDLTAEFFGNFWKNILDRKDIKPTIHFICSELLENAVNHSIQSEYQIMIMLFFRQDELLIHVKNSVATHRMSAFEAYIHSLLNAKDLQQLFVLRIKEARTSGHQKSQVGLITILKDREAVLSWKFEKGATITRVTTQAKIALQGGDHEN